MIIKLSLIFCFLLLITQSAFCQDSYTLDKIVVTSSGEEANSTTGSLKHNAPMQIISAQEIAQENLNSVADLLDYVSGIDLRNRGSFGIQGDLSLQGSTFEQVAVLIDGAKVMDPQTGHHNLDIPLTLYDIQQVEVSKFGDSSLYGPGAFAGSVNIVTKKPIKKSLNVDALFGENALFGQTLSLSIPKESFSTRFSFEHKLAKAARPNTDFEFKTASLYLSKDFDENSIDTLLGYQKKDFGADSFYSNLFPEEEEHTQTFFAKTGLASKLNVGDLKHSLFLRRHRDKFILKRNNPASVNYHTTYVYGYNPGLEIPFQYGDLLFGLDINENQINSTNLGKHSRLDEAGSIGFIPNLGDKFSSDLRLRMDYYQQFGWQESYSFGLGYKIFGENLRLKGCASRAFRAPTFTELFYSDAGNKGNPNLGIEKSDNYSVGLDFKQEGFESSLGCFLRQGRNLIDWTRTLPTEAWSATNLGRVDFRGIEFTSKINPDIQLNFIEINKLIFSYNYITADKKASGFLSKYVLDVLRHQFILDVYTTCMGLKFDWQLSYNKRNFGETYFIGSIYIGKKLSHKDFSLEPFIKVDNFSNAKYTEVGGVLQPGRWIKSGLKFEW